MRYMLRVLEVIALCCTVGYLKPMVFFWALTSLVAGCAVFTVLIVMCIYGFTAPMEVLLDTKDWAVKKFKLYRKMKLNWIP